MRNTQYFTAGQAAKEAGVSKTTISKALHSGRLSYIEKTSAGYRIDPAELFRVFPKSSTLHGKVNDAEHPVNGLELAKIEAERDALRKQVEDLRHSLNRAEENADQWRDQAQRLALTYDGRESLLDGIKRLFGRGH